jgi:acyl-CoA reductase-like NAD-dependent aldehyde dehydrogenase
MDHTEQLRTDYDRYMDGLAIKISNVLDGVEALDAASACAAISAYAIRTSHSNPRTRDEMLTKIVELMRQIVERREQ